MDQQGIPQAWFCLKEFACWKLVCGKSKTKTRQNVETLLLKGICAFPSPSGEDACGFFKVKGTSGCSHLSLACVGGSGDMACCPSAELCSSCGSDREKRQGNAEVRLLLPGLVGSGAWPDSCRQEHS